MDRIPMFGVLFVTFVGPIACSAPESEELFELGDPGPDSPAEPPDFESGATADEAYATTTVNPDSVSALRSVAAWQALFDGAWQSELAIYLPLSTSDDSWQLYNLAYAVDANTAMLRASGNTKYLDRALLYVDNVIARARRSSSFATSQYQDGYLTWVNHSHPQLRNDGKEYPLFESYLWRYVTMLLHTMKSTPGILDNASYRAKYNAILAFTEVNIFDKWFSRGTANIYRVNTHMASHWAFIAMNLETLTTNATRQIRCRQIVNNINYAGLPNYHSSLRHQLVPNAADRAAYFWSENWGSFAHPGQDVSHGNAVAAYIAEAHDEAVYFADGDVSMLANTVNDIILKSRTSFPLYVDGTGKGTGWINDGFIKLGRYDRDLQRKIESHAVGRGTQLYGNGALNAKLLGLH